MGLVLPATIDLLSPGESQAYYVRGLQVAALVVTGIILAGAFLTLFGRAVPVLRPVAHAAGTGSDDGA
jgi:hypothetical protein